MLFRMGGTPLVENQSLLFIRPPPPLSFFLPSKRKNGGGGGRSDSRLRYIYIITPVKVEYGWILYEWADVFSRAEGE